MGRFTSIRGWLEVREDMLAEVRDRIAASKERCAQYGLSQEDAEFYLTGFVFPEKSINWSRYVFYGADIRTYHVEFIEDIIREIAEQINRTDQQFIGRPLGVFHVSSEDDTEQVTIWHVARGRLDKRTESFIYNP